jgi:hypothetical protein
MTDTTSQLLLYNEFIQQQLKLRMSQLAPENPVYLQIKESLERQN